MSKNMFSHAAGRAAADFAAPVKPRLLERAQVTEALLGAVEAFPLVVLTAPMGYGKTTAARALMQAAGRRAFSVTVDPGGHNAAYLWSRGSEQLAAQGSKLGKMFQGMTFSEDPVMQRRALNWTREHLAASSALVIIDDCHHIRDPDLEAFIELTARENIPNLSLLMLSRTRPNLPLEELRLKGLARHFSQDLLEFSEQETAAYFALHGVTDRLTARRAWHFSEGWPAALWLSLQNYQATGELNPAEDLEQLLQSAIFSFYSPADQALLLQLSILDSFSSSQAMAVSGDRHAPRRLRLLRAQNAFISYDAGLNTYRLHSIFRSFLRRLLDEQYLPAAQAVDRTRLYRRAGEWYAEERDLVRAVSFFAQAGEDEDYLHILRLFTAPGAALAVLYDPEGILRAMRAVPRPVLEQCPAGYLAFVYGYISQVDQAEGQRLFNEIEAYFQREDKADLHAAIRGELEVIRGISSFNDLEKAAEHYERAAALLEAPSIICNRRSIWNLGSPHTGFLFLREPGSYKRLVELVEKRGHLYQKVSNGCGSGMEEQTRAEYLLETGDLRRVEPLLMKSVYRASSKGQAATILSVRFIQARMLLAQGQAEAARELFENARGPVAAHGSPLLATSLDLCFGYLGSVAGLPGCVPEWLRQGDWDAIYGVYQTLCFMHIVHGRSLLMDENWPRLEALALDIPTVMGNYNFLFGHIHAQALLSIALERMQRKTESRAALSRAVELCRQDGIILSLAEYGRHLSPLLRGLSRQNPADKFLAALYRFSTRYEYQQPTGPQPESKLTLREQEILKRAIAGHPNHAIAKDLRVQPVTVGNTLTRIYKKLGASNRVEAANIWRELSDGVA